MIGKIILAIYLACIMIGMGLFALTIIYNLI
jgi:hypothetical protein